MDKYVSGAPTTTNTYSNENTAEQKQDTPTKPAMPTTDDVPVVVPSGTTPTASGGYMSPLFYDPKLDGPLVSSDADPGILAAQAMITGVRLSQELSASQASRLEHYSSLTRLKGDKLLDVIADRAEQIKAALEKQGLGKKFGIAMLVVGIVATALTLGTATPLVAGLTAVGTAMTSLVAVNDIMGGELFVDIVKKFSKEELTDEEAQEKAGKLALALTIVGTVLTVGGAASASGLGSKVGNWGKRALGFATKNVDDVARETAKNLAKNSKTLLERFGVQNTDEVFKGIQRSEVLLATVESILSALNSVNGIKLAKHQRNTQLSYAAEKFLNADITQIKGDTDFTVDLVKTINDDQVHKRTDSLTTLIQSVRDGQLSYYTKG